LAALWLRQNRWIPSRGGCGDTTSSKSGDNLLLIRWKESWLWWWVARIWATMIHRSGNHWSRT